MSSFSVTWVISWVVNHQSPDIFMWRSATSGWCHIPVWWLISAPGSEGWWGMCQRPPGNCPGRQGIEHQTISTGSLWKQSLRWIPRWKHWSPCDKRFLRIVRWSPMVVDIRHHGHEIQKLCLVNLPQQRRENQRDRSIRRQVLDLMKFDGERRVVGNISETSWKLSCMAKYWTPDDFH